MGQESLSVRQASTLAEQACLAASARALARATLSARLNGRPGVAFLHLLDYLSGFRAGRIKGDAEPTLASPLPAILYSDADGGIAQYGFDRAMPTLVEKTRTLGVAILVQRNGFTSGELGD